MSSILTDTKKVLNIEATYTVFDQDIMLHVNSVFGTLNQLGIGPTDGFAIEDDTAVWDDFLQGDLRFNPVKTYVYLRVRMLFDPPTTSYLMSAMENQIKELEWRLNVVREGNAWIAPVPGQPISTSTNWYDLTGGLDFPSSAPDGSFGYDATIDTVWVKSSTGTNVYAGYWYDLTGLSDFPPEANIGDFGYDTTTGQVWRKT